MKGTYDEAIDKLKWLVADAEELLAENMERALERQLPGTFYVTRAEHFAIPKGVRVKVWRTKSMTIGVLIEKRFLLDVKKMPNKQTLTGYPPAQEYERIYHTQDLNWIFEGIETEEGLHHSLETYMAAKKWKRRIPETFDPF